MAQSPQYKVYDASGTYQAACKEIEAAACLVALYGKGATIRWQHSAGILWREGSEDQSADESYDYVGEVAFARKRALYDSYYAKH